MRLKLDAGLHGWATSQGYYGLGSYILIIPIDKYLQSSARLGCFFMLGKPDFFGGGSSCFQIIKCATFGPTEETVNRFNAWDVHSVRQH